MYFFTADQHYDHKNIIKYCNRPFSSVKEMNLEIMDRHNSVVGENDIVIHAGDFCLSNEAHNFKKTLNGKHTFLRGSHDRWMGKYYYHEIWEKTIDGQHIVICHYPMSLWARSHYGSWQLFGHVHNTDRHKFNLKGKQMNIGVDTNNFYPYSFEQIKTIMKGRPDNPNLLKK